MNMLLEAYSGPYAASLGKQGRLNDAVETNKKSYHNVYGN